MNKFLKIIVLTSILLFSSCAKDYNPEEFTVREYKKIRNEITEYFENEDFSCKNEADKYEKEAWEDSQGSESNKKYIEPTVCRKITEKKIDGNVYKSEIKYELIPYDWMVYNKNSKIDFYLYVENYVLPKERYLYNNTIVSFHQEISSDVLFFDVESYDEQASSDKNDRKSYISISNFYSEVDEYEFFNEIFQKGLPSNVSEKLLNPEDKIKYFDLIVEKGYATNLLNEFKDNKKDADEIATKFEKSEIYDKIYNLKY